MPILSVLVLSNYNNCLIFQNNRDLEDHIPYTCTDTIGFPEYDPETGKVSKMNNDIQCESVKCDRAKWANPSWRYGNVSGINIQNPAMKDTLIVPWGGYAVVRILADNPGLF